MDMSLDEFISYKKKSAPRKAPLKRLDATKRNNGIRKPTIRSSFKAEPPKRNNFDARLKIIERNRARIRDARDKIVEIKRSNGDVRQKLNRNKHKIDAIPNIALAAVKNGIPSYRPVRRSVALPTRRILNDKALPDSYMSKGDLSRNAVSAPRGYIDYDNMERMEEEEYAAATQLSRTVKNDMPLYDAYGTAHMDSITSKPSSNLHRMSSWSSSGAIDYDPFDVYEVPRERHHSPDLPPPPLKGILRNSRQFSASPTELYQRRYIPDSSSHLSYEMRTRLERAPDPHASMGIFSNSLKSSSSSSLNSSSGYRIVVSNLHTNVTPSDIKELFQDIGELHDSRIVRPGVAEVIYKSLIDAEKAVDTYHNRQLDGLPMNCLLVNPRASNKPTAPAINSLSSSSRHSSSKTPLEIDIDALHKVLFRRN